MGLRKCNPLEIADSLNAPALDDGERPVEVGDLIPDPQAAGELETVDTAAETEYLHKGIEAGLAQLDPIQSGILCRRFYGRQTRAQVAEALHITPDMVRREESQALQALRGDQRVLSLAYLETAAYSGTGWNAWYYRQGSVEERLVERG